MKGQKRREKVAPRLDETYHALWELYKKLGAPPSVREVVAKLGLTKRYISRVHGDLEKMVALGKVERLEIPTRCFAPGKTPPDEIDWDSLVDPQ